MELVKMLPVQLAGGLKPEICIAEVAKGLTQSDLGHLMFEVKNNGSFQFSTIAMQFGFIAFRALQYRPF
jgi:hypothetical protein